MIRPSLVDEHRASDDLAELLAELLVRAWLRRHPAAAAEALENIAARQGGAAR